MKITEKHIDFDFIGNQEPLTKNDIELISDYFKTKKTTNTRPLKRTAKPLKTKEKVS